VIHAALLAAVHEQLVPVTTETAPAVLPVDGTDALVAERLKVQLPAAWVTVNVVPAMVMVPTRWLVVVFAATL
jgi:hypothetical protein